MAAGESAIEMHRGDTLVVSVTAKAENAAGKLVVVDITDSTAFLSVKKKYADEDYELQVEGVVEDGPTGELSFEIEAGATDEMVPGRYRYDVEITLSSGKVYTLLEDQFLLKPDVTRPASP